MRKPGYYWVRQNISDDYWQIAKYYPKGYWMLNGEQCYDDSLYEIDNIIIDRPAPQSGDAEGYMFEVSKTQGRMLLRHVDSFTPEERNRYDELKVLLKEPDAPVVQPKSAEEVLAEVVGVPVNTLWLQDDINSSQAIEAMKLYHSQFNQ